MAGWCIMKKDSLACLGDILASPKDLLKKIQSYEKSVGPSDGGSNWFADLLTQGQYKIIVINKLWMKFTLLTFFTSVCNFSSQLNI